MQSRKAYIPLRDRDAVRFSEFLEQSGLGRSKGYELLNTGQVETFVVGKARFVVVQRRDQRRIDPSQRLLHSLAFFNHSKFNRASVRYLPADS